jgi:hypothetical protein
MWIKTCRTPEGSRLLVCDPCFKVNATVLVIVPGDRVVMARCDHCWCYGNPRDFVEVRLGGRKNAYSGTCLECAGEALKQKEDGEKIHGFSNTSVATGPIEAHAKSGPI